MKLHLPENKLGISEHLILLFTVMFSAYIFIANDLLWRWDNLLYDAQLSLWARPVADDIIIISIDDESLNEIGRWPWSRTIHADLIDKIDAESPSVIGLDIIFSEPDLTDPESDAALARSILKSGKVVLPIFMSKQSSSSYPIEALPLADFAEPAAALGHVHIDISDDGIARQIYLKEGIGEPVWSHYSLAILDVVDRISKSKKIDNEFESTTTDLYALDTDSVSKDHENYSVMQWAREQPYLIPYAGPPGHFQHIGYSQVLSGNYSEGLFQNKIVLIGATAEGLGDALPTPLSGDGGIMPGVEIVANVIDSLQNDISITTLDEGILIALTVLLVAIPLLLYPYLNPSHNLLLLIAVIALTFAVIGFMLVIFNIWIPLSTILLFQFIGYPVWSWRRLVVAMRHIDTELDSLTTRQQQLSLQHGRKLSDEIRFISQFVPIRSWTISDGKGEILDGDSNKATDIVDDIIDLEVTGWQQNGCCYYSHSIYKGLPAVLCLCMEQDVEISEQDIRLMDSLIVSPAPELMPSHSIDVMQRKVSQVQVAGKEYEKLRRIIDDGLSGMADGALICNGLGQVMLSNTRAAWYLKGHDDAVIDGESLIDILQQVRQQSGENWKALLKRVMLDKEHALSYAQHESGRDLLVQISPLKIIGDKLDGFIVNLSDISLLRASERNRNEVLSFLSHDLRSPLASMLAMIELARNKIDPEDMRDMLINMEINTQKTLHLAEQFLQLSRANTNEDINFYDIDFNTIALNAIDQLWALSSKHNVMITYEFDQEECWTNAEPDLLERAIVNLISNAIKHCDEGSQVLVKINCDGDLITCCVHDTGCGIPAEDLPHLFEMFRRAQGSKTGSGRKQGVGLGLAFVDAVVKRHAGEIQVTSTQGKGSSFCMKLPRQELLDSSG